jgi:LPXTG-motif cell wall-anchored protein
MNNNTTTGDSSMFGNLLTDITSLAGAAAPVITAVKGSSATPATKPAAVIAATTPTTSINTILLVGAGLLTVLLVGLMFLRRK